MSKNNGALPEGNAELIVATKRQVVDSAKMVSIESFQKKLNGTPFKDEIKVNQYANNSKYLPISFIEMTLDELFFGQWSVENFQYQVVANEMVGSLELVCLHPVTQREIRRTGAASVMIQMKKGSNPMDVESKIMNTLVKDLPHLKSSCVANAARSLGKIFGRDLNRDAKDNYNPIVTPIIKKQEKTISEKIKDCSHLEVLKVIFEGNQNTILDSTELVEDYNNRKDELRKLAIKTKSK